LRGSKVFIAAGDFHFPHQDDTAVEVFRKVLARVKPDITVVMGDLLDCYMFSAHPPTHGIPETELQADLKQANGLLDFIQLKTKNRTVVIEGNHENRVDRWAIQTKEGRAAYSMVCPRLNLSKNRKRFSYRRYGNLDSQYPHYKLNSRIVAVHGWSYAKNAARIHLQTSQGMSVIFGHTHRAENAMAQKIWTDSGIVQARSCGCMCQRIPMYGVGRPVEWVHAFVIGYMGTHSDTMYTVPLHGNEAVLPDGTEIKV
jgi:predicted phosphodiesterase